jgi:uncharacterized peroxidase-related enzyme
MFIGVVPEESAEGAVAKLYEEDLASRGYVANYTKALSHRPNVMLAWQQLNGAIKSNLDLRLYELATLAAAMRLRSSYCSLAHGKVLAERFYDPGRVGAIARDFRAAGLAPAEVALMEFADKIAADATAVSASDIEGLREHGFGDADIFDIASAAAARCFFSKLLDALGAAPDPAYQDLEHGLRDALTVGRSVPSGAPTKTTQS